MDSRDATALPEAGAVQRDARARPAYAKQRARWAVPVTQPLLLCSQVQRSGGTLLARLFDGHPACFAHPHELKWGRPRKWHWPQVDLASVADPDTLLAQLDEDWPRTFAIRGYRKYSRSTYRDRPEQAQHYPFLFDFELQRRVFRLALEKLERPTQRDVLNAYLTSLFNAWLDYQNLYRRPKQWVTAFVPKLAMTPGGVERFLEDYPDGLFVTIVRHPGAWLSSAIRHLEGSGSEVGLDSWVASADASQRAAEAYPDKVVLLLFEDLVHRTEAVMRKLSDRMGITFDKALLEPTYNSMPVLSDSSYVPTIGIDPDVTTRHTETLAADRLEMVDRVAMPRYLEISRQFAQEGP